MSERRRPPHRGPMAVGEKPRDMKKSGKKLIAYAKKYLVWVAVALTLALFGTVMTLIGPTQTEKITNLIARGVTAPGGVDIPAMTAAVVTLLVIYGLGALFSYAQGFIMATVTQRISIRMRGDISKKINRLTLKYFDSNSFGDVLSRVSNDVDTVGHTLNQSISSLVTAVALFFGSLLMMIVKNGVLAITAVLSTVVGFVAMSLIVSRSQKHFRRQQRALGDIDGHIEEIYSGHNVVVAYNAQEAAKAEFDRINTRLYESAWKSQFMSGLMPPLMNFVGNLGYVAVCVVGAALVVSGSIEIGVVMAFIIYVRLFSNPLSQFAQVMTNLQSTVAASERVFDLLDEEELSDESHKTKRLDSVRGDISFKNVSFGYSKDKTIIRNFSADVKAGQKVAIVGPTGAGKTTMVNLLMRFYEINSGEITIDGVPICDLTRENLHALFGMVLQDTWLFEGTIRDNVVYSKENVTDEEVVRACKAAGIHHFIRQLPKGYDTVLDDKTSLSAGQKQLITIARAMVENAPLLILDEATSSVDTRTEVQIQRAMDTLTEGRTSFVIAHRLSTIRNADLILVMKDGDILESGDHETLLAKGGFYADLYNSQFDPVG